MLNTSKTINPATTIVFIDAGVENAELLIEGVLPTTEVFVLDGTADGIEQISLVLQHRQNIDAVHIISHGSPGCLYLGNSQLSLDTLNGYATQLQQWDVANILLYGCNVAAGDAGAEFITKLHTLTGAEIGASKTLTGSAAKGGNWELEVTTNKAVATLAFKAAALENYPGILVSFIPGEPFGDRSNGVSLGDLNGDGHLDAVTVVEQHDELDPVLGGYNGNQVWLGKGDGTFSPGNRFGAGSLGVSLGNLNGDQLLDAVTVGYNGNQVWLGQGDGTFSPGNSLGYGSNGVSLGDVNGDQKLDAVTVGRNGNQVWFGDGFGGFSQQQSFGQIIDLDGSVYKSESNGVSLGDVNGDKLLDAVTVGWEGNQVWLGKGDGTFSPGNRFGAGSLGVSLGDVNGDKLLDAVTVGYKGDQVWLGNGDGTFSPENPLGSWSNGVSLGDLNGDQKLDAVTVGGWEGNQVWLNVPSNSAPTDISLDKTSIPENVPANTLVGTFSTTDPDEGDEFFTYALVEGSEDNNAFIIDGAQLKIKDSPDYETKSTYNIRVRTTDAGELSYEKDLVVKINDIDETISKTISGSPNNDILRGTAAGDKIDGLAGSDVLYGNAGNDTINGGDGNDIAYGGNDNDVLLGGNGSDRLYGDAGNDELLGGDGDDILYGGDGNDILNGGAGSDRLYGNAGIDTFVLASGMGQDLIYGFQDNLDIIRLDGGLAFGDLQIAQSGSSTLIKVSSTGETLASLVNTNSALIGAEDFTINSPLMG
ncbi:DUF4347 domain-containing protein [Microcoleus sp. B5-D4]